MLYSSIRVRLLRGKMDIPNRLPAPERRKDKISKNDIRYLYKLQKNKNKQARRAHLDQEIDEENKRSEKRARLSSMNAMPKKTAKFSLAKSVAQANKKRHTPGLMNLSYRVYDGDAPPPCVLGPPREIEAEEPSLSEDEVREQHPDALVWREWDYPHIIPHPHLWVVCIHCHRALPTTAVRHFVASHLCHTVPKGHEYFRGGPMYRWTVYHEACFRHHFGKKMTPVEQADDAGTSTSEGSATGDELDSECTDCCGSAAPTASDEIQQ